MTSLQSLFYGWELANRSSRARENGLSFLIPASSSVVGSARRDSVAQFTTLISWPEARHAAIRGVGKGVGRDGVPFCALVVTWVVCLFAAEPVLARFVDGSLCKRRA